MKSIGLKLMKIEQIKFVPFFFPHGRVKDGHYRPRKNVPKTAAKLDILVHVVTLTIMFYELELLMQMKDILWLKT